MALDNDNARLSDEMLAGIAGGTGAAQQGGVTFTCPACGLKLSATEDEVNSFAVITCGYCRREVKLMGFGLGGNVIRMRADCWEG